MIIAALTLLGGAILWFSSVRFEAGYNEAKVLYLEQSKTLQEQLDEAHNEELTSVLDRLTAANKLKESSRERALKLQKKLSKLSSEKVKNEINDIKTNCVDLGTDYNRVLKRLITNPSTEINKNSSETKQ